MQFRYLVFGLLLAAVVVGIGWVNNLPGIPPVRLPAEQVRALNAPGPDARRITDGNKDQRLRLGEDELSDSAAGSHSRFEALPSLNESDGWLRTQLQQTALPWLAETELVRTGATVLENASRGELPRKFLAFLAPDGPFEVRKMGELIQIDPASYERFTPFVKNLERLPPERAAEIFRRVEPLLAEALRELGHENVTPRELAYTALGVALDTPRVDAASALRQPKVMYTYADKTLEGLKPLQKQLLRMGPENVQSLRLWLEDFGLALSPSALLDDDPTSGEVPAPGVRGREQPSSLSDLETLQRDSRQ